MSKLRIVKNLDRKDPKAYYKLVKVCDIIGASGVILFGITYFCFIANVFEYLKTVVPGIPWDDVILYITFVSIFLMSITVFIPCYCETDTTRD